MMVRAYTALLLVKAVLISIVHAQVAPPQITEPLSARTEYVKQDQPLVLQCRATGDPAPKYRWLKGGKEAPTAESMNRVTVDKINGTLKISEMTSNEVGNYQCIADSLVPDGQGGEKMLSALSPFINVQKVYIGSEWTTPDKTVQKKVGEYMGLECMNQPESVPDATYLWYITNNKDKKREVTQDKRIYIDKQGTLHFVFVEKQDQPPSDQMYMCGLFNGPENVIKLGSPTNVGIEEGTPSPQSPVKKYSTSNEDAVFLRNTDAEIECVFSGYDIPQITWYRQNTLIGNNDKYELVADAYNRTLKVKKLLETDEGTFLCKAKNNKGEKEVFIYLDVTSGPIWVEGLSSQTVVEGRDAVFTCEARSAHGETPPNEPVWFMNGKPFPDDNSGKYEFSDRRQKLTVKNVNKLTDINCFQCNVTNHMGYEFADGCLTIIQGIVIETEPNLRQEIVFGQQINLTVVGKTDPSMTLEYLWRFKNDTYKLDRHPPFVTYDPVTKVAFINTSGLNEEQYASVAGIYYRELYHEYDKKVIPIEVILTDKPIVAPVTPAGGSLWWLALIIALIVLIVVIILIVIICNRKMQEGTYPVDKKERSNDLDPEKELADSGFHDLSHAPGDPDFASKKTPSINPNFDYGDDMEMGDDDESLMEYGGGDFDTTKFNEDGSFIGQYSSQNKTPQVVQSPQPLNHHPTESQI